MKAYLEILQDVLDNGRERGDRTGTGTISIFDARFKHDMRTGFPLPTTKQMFLRGCFEELMAFLNNDLHLLRLLEKNVKIWDGFRLQEPAEVRAPYSFAQRIQALGDKLGNQFPDLDLPGFEELLTQKGIPTDRVVDTLPAGSLNAPYGAGWRAYQTAGGKVDQFKYAMDLLRNNPESRRILVSAWNPGWMPDESITPQENIAEGNPCLTPCHWAFEFYTEEMTADERVRWLRKNNFEGWSRWNHQVGMDIEEDDLLDDIGAPTRYLSLKWHQRSCDMFLGIPFNIASYAMLLMMVAEDVGMVPYMLVGDLTNVHVYSNHLPQVKEQLTREPHPLPQLSFKRKPERIEDYQWEDVLLENYEYHPAIKGDIAV